MNNSFICILFLLASFFCVADEETLLQKGYYSSHEGAFHRLLQISVSGEQITLNDGSVWKVAEKDRHKTVDWMMNDIILICPNNRLFSTCNYKLCNESADSKVEVNLFKGPNKEGKETYKIVLIGYYDDEIVLSDSSVWKVAGSDRNTLKKWRIGDTVLIGTNDLWFSTKPNILININLEHIKMPNFVYAVCED